MPLGGTIHLALHGAPSIPPQGVIHPISFGVGIFHFLLTRGHEHRGVTFSLGEGHECKTKAVTSPRWRLFFGNPSFNSAGTLDIGMIGSSFEFDGWIDELRITKDVARYASDSGFAVPTSAYPRP